MDGVFLSLSFRGESWVALRQTALHIPSTRVIDLRIYLQTHLGRGCAQYFCLFVNRDEFHFVDLKVKNACILKLQ